MELDCGRKQDIRSERRAEVCLWEFLGPISEEVEFQPDRKKRRRQRAGTPVLVGRRWDSPPGESASFLWAEESRAPLPAKIRSLCLKKPRAQVCSGRWGLWLLFLQVLKFPVAGQPAEPPVSKLPAATSFTC